MLSISSWLKYSNTEMHVEWQFLKLCTLWTPILQHFIFWPHLNPIRCLENKLRPHNLRNNQLTVERNSLS